MLLELQSNGATLDGKPFYIASGDMHYFRFFKEGWRRRLQLMKDFGLTVVQTYVPWDLHEPSEGEYNFEGNLNLGEFLQLCDEIGLKVFLRPSVYMCSEWDFGGMPHWLQQKSNICVRTCDEQFLQCVKKYFTRLSKEFLPYLSTKGGPIIAMAVENEYGSFGDDAEYIKWTGDLMRELGVDVPLYTANGFEKYKMQYGSRKEYWTCLDLHALTDEAKANILEYQPDKPIYIAEFWAGRGIQWGGYFARQAAEDVAANYKSILSKGAFVNFYMFCGGTNFGFMNGALEGKYNCGVANMPDTYIPFATSYDVDAPVTEYGEPTEKYYLCKQVLKEYMESNGFEFGGSDETAPVSKVPTQAIGEITLTESADLLGQAETLCTKKQYSGKPLTMDALGQDYGYILYTTNVRYTDDLKRILTIRGLHDRALVYGNGKYLGCYMRDRKSEPIVFDVPKEGLKLEILVENMGRINYGNALHSDKKGICGFVKLDVIDPDGSVNPHNYGIKMDWQNYSLPMKNPDKASFDNSASACRPAIFKGTFDAQPGVDTFVNMQKLHKGNVWINGFNLGRYWEIGPQGTLYVPGELLQEHNTIHVLELHNTENVCKVSFDDKPSMDTINKDEFFKTHENSGKYLQNN
ncbi:MAG: beta-galactosidase [Clostridia bacterium]|nr:beta-galactosidase [Clostridia bacterium]